MPAREYQVKGSTLRSKLDFVHEIFGSSARSALESQLSDRDLFPILVSAWYDYDLYVELLEAIAANHYGGDLSRLTEVGAYSADQALRSVYAAFVRSTGFVEFLRGISRLHHMFYNSGYLDVDVADDQSACSLIHREKPRFAEADLWVAQGFYCQAAALHGLDQVRCSFETDAPIVRFELSW